jgi:hypothetical protein
MDALDFPFEEVAERAEKLVARGGVTVFQKWTCSQCRARQTMDVPDTFYTTGQCEECGAITDIVAAGCNYMAIFTVRRLDIPEPWNNPLWN